MFAPGILILFTGLIGVWLSEPWSSINRAISGDGLFAEPGVVRFAGWVWVAVGVALMVASFFAV
jgi:hypothetical protein